MYTLLISEEATWDVLEALDYYNNLDRNLSERLQNEIANGFSKIHRTPFAFQIKYQKVRVYFCKTFPYGIHYLVGKVNIKIIAVFHTSRDPKNWEERNSSI